LIGDYLKNRGYIYDEIKLFRKDCLMTQAAVKPGISKVLANTNFKLLWIGQGTSLLGDQFFLIALPWLVLKLTNDPLALGTVLALAGIPRALFMLLGGAITDRYSPRSIMLISDILRLALTALMTLLILTGSIQMWMVYLLALSFGVISGFFIPASSAMMPSLVDPADLQVSNSLYQGTGQLTNFVGPVLAGGLIALLGHSQTGGGAPELTGIAAAMAVDVISFLISVFTLWLMTAGRSAASQAGEAKSILGAIWEGIRYMWQDGLLRLMFIMMVVLNFLFVGPLLVGLPVLANSRLNGGAAAFGLVMGAYGGGNLVGIILAATVVRLLKGRFSGFMVGVVVAFGVALIFMGYITSTAAAFLLLLLVGTGNGCLGISLITSMQRQTPKAMLGRVMSLVMLAGVGLVPVSQALTGALLKLTISGVFAGAGVLILATAVWLAFHPSLHLIDKLMTAEG
jgi:MFS family permease